MSDRPYLTSAEAATYCGFKTIGGIQQAVRRGKLKPAGRRGGTGTYVFAREDLDAFLTGGLQPHERLFVPPEVNEAARLGAGTAQCQTAAKPRRPAKSPPAAGSSRAPKGPIAAGPPLPAAKAAPVVAPQDGGKTAKRPPRIAAVATAKPTAKPPTKRDRKTASDDPVRRIVDALSGASTAASSRRDKAAKRKRPAN